MQPLRLIFVLKQNNLFLIVKKDILSYDLTEYNFDTKKEITPGKNANHLMQADSLIKTIKSEIKKRLTTWEKWKYGLLFEGKEAIFISDAQMNNLAIKHFCNFTQQVGTNRCVVYHEPKINTEKLIASVRVFLENAVKSDAIGRVDSKGYYYKVEDNSIELVELRRVI